MFLKSFLPRRKPLEILCGLRVLCGECSFRTRDSDLRNTLLIATTVNAARAMNVESRRECESGRVESAECAGGSARTLHAEGDGESREIIATGIWLIISNMQKG